MQGRIFERMWDWLTREEPASQLISYAA